ncbi:MAG TPA: SDR family NAD(P)-dependent oxidoreductase [Desulfosporosinus sp.]|nr:SDR family NAD(P)-dependent oxidoreductase [Desulfosporosinus sp.]
MDFQQDFKGKVVIVTGAGGGLGGEVARQFAKAGAKVTVADFDVQNGLKVVKALKAMGSEAIFVEVDVTKEESCIAMVDATVKAFGGVDILVNNAGKGGPHVGYPLTRIQSEDWDISFQVNVRGTFFCVKAVYNIFMKQKHGKIVSLSSIAGKAGDPALPHYSSAKAAIINMSQAYAKEMGPYNINVNVVCPGLIYTPIWESLGSKLAESLPTVYPNMTARQVFEDSVKKKIIMKREQTEEDVAYAVLFLASEAAKNITGQALNVDGGAVM